MQLIVTCELVVRLTSTGVEGLNIKIDPKYKSLKVITFCRKRNKFVNVITFGLKCNKLLSRPLMH